MKYSVGIAVAASLLINSATFAQISPPTSPMLQNRVPAPQPPAVQPPAINGTLSRGGNSSPKVYQPPQLNTFGDRVTKCLNEGAAYGMNGQALNSYARACGNSK
jgi:hypothetical protein